MHMPRSAFAFVACAAAVPAAAQTWSPAPAPLRTRWAADVSPANAWPQYPRPTLVRERWQNLNGLWDYAIAEGDAAPDWNGQSRGRILVPFPIESSLSGVGGRLTAEQTLHYRRVFECPVEWRSGRILLHFGAVDWECAVAVNGRTVGTHRGGYDPFSFDITEALRDGANELTVTVKDPTNRGGQPRGKQWDTSHAIWYTPTSGIWQTVWLEPVGPAHLTSARVEHDGIGRDEQGRALVRNPRLVLGTTAGKGIGARLTIDAPAPDLADRIALREDDKRPDELALPILLSPQRLWSPDSPTLYSARVELLDEEARVLDSARISFGLRDIAVTPDASGVHRLFLNGEALFHFGPLDQGYWPDGLYTPPTEEAMRFDIEAVKRMGGNMLRKHVKVESERFYHLCDALGVMVWQDMPSPFFKSPHFDENFPALSDPWRANFERELRALIDTRRHHPSIVVWVPFNEGWGQNDLEWAGRVVDQTKSWDPSRPVNCASGWTDTGNGDLLDIHVYPGPATSPPSPPRAVVLGEYGGLGLPLEGHTWADKANWGYVSYTNKEDLTAAYLAQLAAIPLLIGEGLSAAVYTQTTDVEIEVNGWLTYDRAVWKIDPEQAAPAARRLYEPPPRVLTILPRAGRPGANEGPPWRYTFEAPGQGWESPGYDDSAWSAGFGGFGSEGTPGAIIATEWTSPEIYLRRTIDLGGPPVNPVFTIHHDEDAEVYVNGILAATLKGYTTGYTHAPILAPAAAELRKGGTITLAVRCRQTRGGQYIDVGIADVVRDQDAASVQ